MGRKSALTPDQWIEIERRIVLEGESAFALAKEFGVNESTIRRKIKPSSADKAERAQKLQPDLRQIAEAKAQADTESRRVAAQIAELPYAKQQIVDELSRRLVNVSGHMASAAEYGAATAHRLSALANSEVAKIDDADVISAVSMAALHGVAALTKVANDASHIPINLLSAKIKVAQDPEAKGAAGSAEIIKSLHDLRAKGGKTALLPGAAVDLDDD